MTAHGVANEGLATALGQRRLLQQFALRLAKVAAGLGHRLLLNGRQAEQLAHIVGGRAGDDSVEIGGKPLGFHQGFPSAVRTAGKVGSADRAALVGDDQGLGNVGGLLQRPPAEVDRLFRMAERPGGVGADLILVAVVRAGHRIAGAHIGAELDERDLAGESAVADLKIFAVPVPAFGDPQLQADVGIGGRPAGHRYPADQPVAQHFLDGFGHGRMWQLDRAQVDAGGLGMGHDRRGKSGQSQGEHR